MVKQDVGNALVDDLRKFLQAILPPDWRWRLRVPDRPSEADALLDLNDPRGTSMQLRVELKSRLFPSDIVRQLRWYGESGPWLVAAPVVGARARQLLADEGISWIELGTEECRIAVGPLRIERLPARGARVPVTGAGTTRAPAATIRGAGTVGEGGRRYVADPFSGKALRIVRWLLIDPQRQWTLEEMVTAARASPGFVSRTFATLERDAYMERQPGANRVRDAEGLLAAWAAAPPPADRAESRVSLQQSPQAILDAIRGIPQAPRYALTAEAAAEQVAPFARFSRVEMYVDETEPWERLLDLTPVPRGGNVDLIVPADAGVFDGSRRTRELWLVSRPQLYVDLKRRAGPAAEAADFLRDRGAIWPQ